MKNRKLAASIALAGAAALTLTACSSDTEPTSQTATEMATETTSTEEVTEVVTEEINPTEAPKFTPEGPDYSIKSSGGGTEQDSYITIDRNSWFVVPQPVKVLEGVDFGMKVDFDETLIERPAGFTEVPQDLIDNPPAFGVDGNESNGVYKSLDKAGETVITTTFENDKGETEIWKMKVTIK
jgi:hypothetical protein